MGIYDGVLTCAGTSRTCYRGSHSINSVECTLALVMPGFGRLFFHGGM